jgi:kynurenine formamidase
MQDLTHPIEAEMPVYPGDPVVEMWPDATYGDDGYRVSAFGMGTHTGTHVDAPGHVEPDGRMLDDCPLERFEGEAVPMGGDLLSHHELLGADGLIVENLTNLDGLPPRIRFEALPLALAGVEGAPVRALARTGDDADPTV